MILSYKTVQLFLTGLALVAIGTLILAFVLEDTLPTIEFKRSQLDERPPRDTIMTMLGDESAGAYGLVGRESKPIPWRPGNGEEEQDFFRIAIPSVGSFTPSLAPTTELKNIPITRMPTVGISDGPSFHPTNPPSTVTPTRKLSTSPTVQSTTSPTTIKPSAKISDRPTFIRTSSPTPKSKPHPLKPSSQPTTSPVRPPQTSRPTPGPTRCPTWHYDYLDHDGANSIGRSKKSKWTMMNGKGSNSSKRSEFSMGKSKESSNSKSSKSSMGKSTVLSTKPRGMGRKSMSELSLSIESSFSNHHRKDIQWSVNGEKDQGVENRGSVSLEFWSEYSDSSSNDRLSTSKSGTKRHRRGVAVLGAFSALLGALLCVVKHRRVRSSNKLGRRGKNELAKTQLDSNVDNLVGTVVYIGLETPATFNLPPILEEEGSTNGMMTTPSTTSDHKSGHDHKSHSSIFC